MLRSFLLNWISARYSKEVKDRIYEAAAETLGAAMSADEPDGAGGVRRAEVGFLFSRGAEYGCFTDRMENPRITKGNGFTFVQGEYKGIPLAVAETGAGETNVREGTLALLQVFQPRRVIASGFADALSPEIGRQEVFMPLELVSERGERLNLSGEERGNADNPGTGGEMPWQIAPLVSVSKLPADPEGRRELGRKSGARLADTLVWNAASVCREANVPFLALKVVAAELGDRLPPDLSRAEKAGSGSRARRLGAFLGTFTNRPSSLVDVYKIKQRELESADRLADHLAGLLDEISRNRSLLIEWGEERKRI